jgi:large subunit ribosomal protein L10
MLKSQKAEIIAKLAESFETSAGVVVCEYKGLTVANLETLRKAAKAKDTSVQVVKNTLGMIALEKAGMTGVDLKDTNILVWSEDAITAPKVAADFAKGNDKFVIKAGYIDKEPADAEKVNAYAKLPGREELLGMLASVWMGPIRNFTIGLDALKRKKEEA